MSRPLFTRKKSLVSVSLLGTELGRVSARLNLTYYHFQHSDITSLTGSQNILTAVKRTRQYIFKLKK